MKSADEAEGSELFTLSEAAAVLGCSTENLRALEKRGRLPEGCQPAVDEITGTRTWTRDQVQRMKEWNDERLGKKSEL